MTTGASFSEQCARQARPWPTSPRLQCTGRGEIPEQQPAGIQGELPNSCTSPMFWWAWGERGAGSIPLPEQSQPAPSEQSCNWRESIAPKGALPWPVLVTFACPAPATSHPSAWCGVLWRACPQGGGRGVLQWVLCRAPHRSAGSSGVWTSHSSKAGPGVPCTGRWPAPGASLASTVGLASAGSGRQCAGGRVRRAAALFLCCAPGAVARGAWELGSGVTWDWALAAVPHPALAPTAWVPGCAPQAGGLRLPPHPLWSWRPCRLSGGLHATRLILFPG